MEEGPGEGLEPIDKWQDLQTCGKAGEYYLIYFGHQRPEEWLFELPRNGLSKGMSFTVEVLDTWNMTITPADGVFKVVTDELYRYHAEGLKKVKLSGKPFLAIRVRRLAGDTVVKHDEAKRIYGE